MADLMLANSTYASGTNDTATTLVNNVSATDAQQPNGVASGVVQIETVLGTSSDLKGTKASLAERLNVQIPTTGLIHPIAAIVMYGGSAAPTGWLLCDGSAVNRTTYSDLFAVISTTYGAGDGSTTFNVPDMRSRVPIGVGTGTGGGASGTGSPSGGSALNAVSRASWAGTEDAINVTHDHGTSGTHQHNLAYVTGSGAGNTGLLRVTDGSGTGTTNVEPTTVTVDSSGASGTDKNLPPYMGVNFIIKT